MDVASPRDRIVQAFKKFDIDGKKTIEWDHLMRVMKLLSPSYAENDAKSALLAAGKLQGGSIPYEDFVDWVFQQKPAECLLAEKPADIIPRKPSDDSPRRAKRSATKEAADQEAVKIANMQAKSRRANVCSESIATSQVEKYEKPVFPKDDSAKTLIKRTLTENDKLQVLCGHLEGKDLEDLINAFQKTQFSCDDAIITQGAQGDRLYIIAEGQVDVFVARPSANGQIAPGDRGSKVVSFGPGALFGELALMYSAPRAATVIAASPIVKLWALEQLDFKMLLAQSAHQQFVLYEGWLRQVDIFSSLNHYELSRLSELLESTLYDEDEVIIQQGDPGSTLYLLEDGECAAFIAGSEGEKEVKRYVNQGDYFGELALLTSAPRKATVRPLKGGCAVVSISRDVFVDILGPLSDMLRERGTNYAKYEDIIKNAGQ